MIGLACCLFAVITIVFLTMPAWTEVVHEPQIVPGAAAARAFVGLSMALSLGTAWAGAFLVIRRRSLVTRRASLLIAAVVAANVLPWCFLGELASRGGQIGFGANLQRVDAIERGWQAEHPKGGSEFHSDDEEALAKHIFWSFLHDRLIRRPNSRSYVRVPETNVVFCFCYGVSNVPLSAEFMAAFTNPTPRVITGTNELLFRDSGVIVERQTGRPAAIVALRGLVVHEETADVTVRYIDSDRRVAYTMVLGYALRNGLDWSQTGGFAMTSPIRWGPNLLR
jgi:hypothetical protein